MRTVESVLAEELFGFESENIFAVLDGASVPGLLERLASDQPAHECLYRGELEPDMREVAPYLVALEKESEFTKWVFERGWTKHWGVLAETGADLRAMRLHLRRFLTVHDEAGKPMLFRYYDPRVLRVYLPTCNKAELEEFFGPIKRFVLEGESGEPLSLEIANGALKKRTLGDGTAGVSA